MSLPDPTPALWAPNLRRTLTRFLARMDRRKARRQGLAWFLQAEAQWQQDYTAWWMEHGWHEGADNPATALYKLRARR